MTTEQFAYWLQGFSEIHQEAPSAEQWQIIRDHLALVFKKETPNRHVQDVLRQIGQPGDFVRQATC